MTTLDPAVESLVARASSGAAALSVDVVQTLWGGYGQILRVRLSDPPSSSVIVKRVQWPTATARVFSSALDHDARAARSHERKVTSYGVEASFYRAFASSCANTCRVPTLLAVDETTDGVIMVLEDLDAAGFGARRQRASRADVHAGLQWLANFHATFLGTEPTTLWETGTYWHVKTRPDELRDMQDVELARAAVALDDTLRASAFLTLVHGDAKLANFCFSSSSDVAAVDFQYVGGGAGIKDVAYFLGSCLDDDECAATAEAWLDVYFAALEHAVNARRLDVDTAALMRDWRALYPVAWTDFERFMAGWRPRQQSAHVYTLRLRREALERL